jgi:hypothetical protein
MSEDYIERLKKVEKDLEYMLNFEKRALDKWPKPTTQEQADEQRDFTEPIIRIITAYETALGYLRQYFPELEEKQK